ncbi:MAG: GAF domain-containing protein [Myxococcales bacterium]|nr:GAF domain-containing protein [Myxococcales bacterium]
MPAETYAVPRGANTPEVVRFGEGLVGEVARSRELMVVDDVPRSAMKIVSATMDAEVGTLVLVPIIIQGRAHGRAGARRAGPLRARRPEVHRRGRDSDRRRDQQRPSARDDPQ